MYDCIKRVVQQYSNTRGDMRVEAFVKLIKKKG